MKNFTFYWDETVKGDSRVNLGPTTFIRSMIQLIEKMKQKKSCCFTKNNGGLGIKKSLF